MLDGALILETDQQYLHLTMVFELTVMAHGFGVVSYLTEHITPAVIAIPIQYRNWTSVAKRHRQLYSVLHKESHHIQVGT